MLSARTALLSLLALCGGTTACFAETFAPIFSMSLADTEQKAIGLSSLSLDQVDALDAAVKHDVTLAQQGNVPAFANSFSQRRTPGEREKLGLTLLSGEQVARLDTAVARTIANQPHAGTSSFARSTAPASPIIAVQFPRRKWDTHGSAEFTVGSTSGHGSFYGGALNVNTTDPSGSFTASVTVSEYHGKGLYPYCRDGYWRY